MFVENLSPQEEEKNKQQQVNAPTVGGGGGGAVAGGIAQQAGNFSTITPTQAPQPVQKWATAQDYLRANQPQANILGQKVESKLGETLTGAKQAIETGAETAKKAVEAGTTPFQEALISEARTTPTAVTGSEQKLQDFLKQWNAAYQGPESFEQTEAYTPAMQAAQKAGTQAELLKSTGGREQLLGEQFDIYGAGNKGLDQAILQQAQQYGNIQALAPQFTGLQDYLTQKSGEVSSAAEQAKAATEATKQQTQQAFTGRLSEFQNQLMSKVQEAQQEAQKVADKYQVDLAQGNEKEVVADLKAAGASETELKQINDYMRAVTDLYKGQITPSQITSFNPATYITSANVATPEQYAEAQALQKLTGVDYSGVLNPAQAEQAGTAPKTSTGMKAGDVQQYLTKKLGTHDKELMAKKSFKDVATYLGLPTNEGYQANDQERGAIVGRLLVDAIRRQVPDMAQRLKIYDSYIPKGMDRNAQSGTQEAMWRSIEAQAAMESPALPPGTPGWYNGRPEGYYHAHPEALDPFQAMRGYYGPEGREDLAWKKAFNQ